MEAHERYRELLEELREHNYRYHVLGVPTIDDNAYDLLYRELQDFEEEHPELADPSSLTSRVGAAPDEIFAPVRHRERMFSLDNAMDMVELNPTLDERNVTAELAVELILSALGKTIL